MKIPVESARHGVNTKLASGLAKLGLVMRHQAWSAGGLSGLTPTQSQVLALLAVRGVGGVSISTIAAELAVTQPTVSDAVAALQRKMLVCKAKLAGDARVVLVRLTPSGARRAAGACRWPDVLLGAIDTLDEAERVVFARALVKMIHTLQEAGQIPVGRMCTSCVHFRPHAHAGASRPHHCAYVDAPLGDTDLRFDCQEHTGVAPELRPRLWQSFVEGVRPGGAFPSASCPSKQSLTKA